MLDYYKIGSYKKDSSMKNIYKVVMGLCAGMFALNISAYFEFSPVQCSYNLHNMLYVQRLSSKDMDMHVESILQSLQETNKKDLFPSLPKSQSADQFLKSYDQIINSLFRLNTNKNLIEFQSHNSMESFSDATTLLLKRLYIKSSLSPQQLATFQTMYQELIDNIITLQPRVGKKLAAKWQTFSNFTQEYSQALIANPKNFNIEIMHQSYNQGLISEIWAALTQMVDYLTTQIPADPNSALPSHISSGIMCCNIIALQTLCIAQYTVNTLALYN